MLIYDKKTKSMKWIDLEETKQADGKEIVTNQEDYIPELSQLQVISAGQLKKKELKYEFEDGKDNGSRIYNITDKSLDKTERDEIVEKIRNMTNEEIGRLNEIINEEVENAENTETTTTTETTTE